MTVAMLYLPPRDRDGRPSNRPALKQQRTTAKDRFVAYWKTRGAFPDAMIEQFWAEAVAEQKRIAAEAKKRADERLARQGKAKAPRSARKKG